MHAALSGRKGQDQCQLGLLYINDTLPNLVDIAGREIILSYKRRLTNTGASISRAASFDYFMNRLIDANNRL